MKNEYASTKMKCNVNNSYVNVNFFWPNRLLEYQGCLST